MLRRAGASATSLAPLLWPARSPLHYHKLLSAEAAAGNGPRARYISGSVGVGSAEIWLRCDRVCGDARAYSSSDQRAGEGRSIHRNAGVKANRCAPFASQATEEEYFPRWNCGGADSVQNRSGKDVFMTSTYSPRQRLSRRFSTCTT